MEQLAEDVVVKRCPICGRPLAEHNRHDRYNHSAKGRARRDWRNALGV
jgi:hypothetical protein